jgi:hypothetical protein
MKFTSRAGEEVHSRTTPRRLAGNTLGDGDESNEAVDEDVVVVDVDAPSTASESDGNGNINNLADRTGNGELQVAADLHVNKSKVDDDDADDTPSPPRVILDLIDATCHEIIHLGGDNMHSNTDNHDDDDDEVMEFIMPSCTSYAKLDQRLRYYMELLNQGYPNGEQPRQPIVLEKGTTVWFRLVMAKIILDIFAKEAYPHDEDVGVLYDESKQVARPALMDIPPKRWKKLRWAFTELRDALPTRDDGQPSLPTEKMDMGTSLICVMEGFEALATLRKQVRSLNKKLDSTKFDDDDTISKHLERYAKYVGRYEATSERIQAKLQKERSFDNLFIKVPSCTGTELAGLPLPNVAFKTSEFVSCLISYHFSKQIVPVQHFKFVLLSTMKEWNRSYLPKPALFDAGRYFMFKGEEVLPSTIVNHTQSESMEGCVPDKSVVKMEPKGLPNMEEELSTMPVTNRMRAKRIPYTEVEKECLLKGVRKFGVGRWSDILEHYSDVFNVNQRSNVNLKDLYRTLTKKNESNKV